MRISDCSSDVCSSDLGEPCSDGVVRAAVAHGNTARPSRVAFVSRWPMCRIPLAGAAERQGQNPDLTFKAGAWRLDLACTPRRKRSWCSYRKLTIKPGA